MDRLYYKCKNFIKRNARPLDLARFEYLFESGPKERVLEYLKAYQNEDGGFGHGLESDCLNPISTPLQTWCATRILEEVKADKKHPIVKGILHYLSSGAEYEKGFWHGLSTVKSNNAYPHAPWWGYVEGAEDNFNPSASLAGFVLKYGKEGTELYQKAEEITRRAFAYLQKTKAESMHEVSCLLELYEYLKELSSALVDLSEFRELLAERIKALLTYDTSLWRENYVCKPSFFIKNKESEFYKGNEEICAFEVSFLESTLMPEGFWPVNWAWNNEYKKEWAISENFWRSDIIIKNLSFFKNMG